MNRLLTAVFLLASLPFSSAWAQLVSSVRSAVNEKDFAKGERLIDAYKKDNGVTPEMILALSWLGRGAQAAQDWERAERHAAETRKLALAELQKRPLDAETQLPLALGASIEVQAHTMAARNARTEALLFLDTEVKRWRDTSIRTRIQKNVHLLSLEGKPSPALDMKEYLGAKPVPVAQLKGKPLILFFWAHWCGDCKYQAPILTRLQQEFGPRGLLVLGPTQRYGYIAGGVDSPPAQELKYIAEIREKFYGGLDMTVPVSEENFKNWGSSTTPTLVVVDRQGVVRLYHPGRMSYEELAPIVRRVVDPS
jgi:thiol-disulfide isomerase/thioredoxin